MKLLATTALAAVLFATPAIAQEVIVRLGAASEGGGYHRAMTSLGGLIGRRDNMRATLRNYEGSESIANALCANEIDIAPAQVDALFLVAQKSGCRLQPLGVYGFEYAQLLVPPDSDIDNLRDLNEDSNVLVGELGSGSALTWDTFVTIEGGDSADGSAWMKAKPMYDAHDYAEGHAATGGVDAVFIVTAFPHQVVTDLLAAGWEHVDLTDGDLDDMKFGKAPLYEKAEIDVEGRWSDPDVYKVKTVYLASPDWAKRRDRVSKMVMRALTAIRR